MSILLSHWLSAIKDMSSPVIYFPDNQSLETLFLSLDNLILNEKHRHSCVVFTFGINRITYSQSQFGH